METGPDVAPGAVVIRLAAWSRADATVQGFVPGRDRIAFPPGFLARAVPGTPPSARLRACRGPGGTALLAADTAAAGWRIVAEFPGVPAEALADAILAGRLLAPPADPDQRMKRERSALAASGATRSRT